ncbi:glycosyl hydrolase family 18 protein [Paenibacillus motobuensis]|uniref:Glycosyl hydrolase n=1 Tax=Paenibacillus motobuensis TaxID=295324 RepID=A0ABP3IMJ3_9BACL
MKSTRSEYYRGRRRKKRGVKWIFGFILIIIGGYLVSSQFLPNRQHVDPDWKGKFEKPIFYDGAIMDYSALGSEDSLKLPLPVIQEVIDPHIRYEEESKSVILTTPKKLVFLKTDEKTAKINNKPMKLLFSPEEKDGVLYLPVHLLKELYGIEIHEDTASGAVLLYMAGENVQKGEVSGPAKPKESLKYPLRVEPNIRKPIVADVKPGTKFRILGDVDDWYHVQLDNGYTGYLQAKHVEIGESVDIPKVVEELSPAKQKWKSKAVNLTWEAVYEVAPKPANIGELPGVNVVSPTWFSLIDGEGNVKSKADINYVKWAHGRGMQVWGLFNNSFDPDVTSGALASFENRMTTILQMLQYAKLYDLDGINIDYENVYTKDGDNLTQFMRELRPLAQEYGLVVSIDVTPKSNSEMWSAFLDRKSLGEIVDYLILMAYDEHWAASPVAGSVASLPWTASSASRILDEDNVPPEKMILAVPLYTRVWSETEKDGKVEVKSKAIGMIKAQKIIEEKKLKPVFSEEAGQNYVEYTEDQVRYRIWLEDEVSLNARVKLIKSLKLGGVASWNRSFASDKAWETLKEVTQAK